MEESKISLGARILPANGLARIPAAYGPCFLLQFLSAQVVYELASSLHLSEEGEGAGS